MNEYKRRYAVNFDLNIEKLRQYYNAEYPKRAYHAIAQFMERNGFEHRQYSGYISSVSISQNQFLDRIRELHTEFPWLIRCENKMDATVIVRVFDLKEMMQGEIMQEELHQENQLEFDDFEPALEDLSFSRDLDEINNALKEVDFNTDKLDDSDYSVEDFGMENEL